MCDRASYMKMTRGTNLMQQLWFIIINISTCFGASICPSSGVQVVCCCVWCSALDVVAVVLRSRCVVLCTVCEFVSHTVHKATHQLIRTTATTPGVEHHMQQYTIWIPQDGHIDAPKHVEIFVIINHNCSIKLVPLVIFIYDARSHIHHIWKEICVEENRL